MNAAIERPRVGTMASSNSVAPGAANYETMAKEDLEKEQTVALMKRITELKEQKLRNTVKMKEMQDKHEEMQRLTESISVRSEARSFYQSQKSELRDADLQEPQPKTIEPADEDAINYQTVE